MPEDAEVCTWNPWGCTQHVCLQDEEEYTLDSEVNRSIGIAAALLSKFCLLQVDGDDTPDSTPAQPRKKKKKKKAIGDLHEGADSLQIGFGNQGGDDEEEYEYEPPPPPEHDTNEVERVANPHPALWNPYEHFKLDISEVR